MSGRPAQPIDPAREEEQLTQPPPLNPGDHLSRAEFERRYRAHPEIKQAD